MGYGLKKPWQGGVGTKRVKNWRFLSRYTLSTIYGLGNHVAFVIPLGETRREISFNKPRRTKLPFIRDCSAVLYGRLD